MAIFKYTVANKEGKKLSGSVEAPDETTARTELNNLDFSILSLKETQEKPEVDATHTKFVFEAIDKNSKLVSGTIPEKDEKEAFAKLQTEYNLTVSAIWQEGATPEQIQEARNKGTQALQEQMKLKEKPEETPQEDLASQKRDQFIKAKIENILKEVHELLKKYDKEIDPNQKAEINKKIDKLLRIKHSTNLDYILASAEELLEFIQAQEKFLKEKGYQEKRFEFKVETKKLIDELGQGEREKNFSEDIVYKINQWQAKNIVEGKEPSAITKFINSLLTKIEDWFTTPPEIARLKEQIKIYNKQLWEFVKLYFKEPTPEYKTKVKNSMKSIWNERKKAKAELKRLQKELKEKKKTEKVDEGLSTSFVQELNALTGWLLAFYIMYYFASLYLKTKDFGLASVPKGFLVYESQIFKYILVTIFLLHATTALKVNFFKKSMIANIILPPVFIFGTIITLLNF